MNTILSMNLNHEENTKAVMDLDARRQALIAILGTPTSNLPAGYANGTGEIALAIDIISTQISHIIHCDLVSKRIFGR